MLEHHRTRTFQEEYLAFLKKHGAQFDEKHLWDSLRPIIPYPTGRFFRGTIGVGTKVGFAPPSEPDWQISCIRLSSWWLTFKKIGMPQSVLVLRSTSPPR